MIRPIELRSQHSRLTKLYRKAAVPLEHMRGEIYSVERLEALAANLAATDVIAQKRQKGLDLLSQLARNGRQLVETYQAASGALLDGRWVSPAADWLVNN